MPSRPNLSVRSLSHRRTLWSHRYWQLCCDTDSGHCSHRWHEWFLESYPEVKTWEVLCSKDDVLPACLFGLLVHCWEYSFIRRAQCCSFDTQKNITDVMRFVKCIYNFLWIWNGHSFPDTCTLRTSNSFWILQSSSHFECTIFQFCDLHSMNKSIQMYAPPYIHVWYYRLWQEINEERFCKVHYVFILSLVSVSNPVTKSNKD